MIKGVVQASRMNILFCGCGIELYKVWKLLGYHLLTSVQKGEGRLLLYFCISFRYNFSFISSLFWFQNCNKFYFSASLWYKQKITIFWIQCVVLLITYV